MAALLSVHQVAAQIGFLPAEVRLMARRGEIPALQFGGTVSAWRFRQAAIDKHIATLDARNARRAS